MTLSTSKQSKTRNQAKKKEPRNRKWNNMYTRTHFVQSYIKHKILADLNKYKTLLHKYMYKTRIGISFKSWRIRKYSITVQTFPRTATKLIYLVLKFINENEQHGWHAYRVPKSEWIRKYTKTKLRIEYVCKTMYHEIEFFISIENDKDYVFTPAYL